MWQRPGSNAVQRPTSFVWVERAAISCSSSARWAEQKSAKAAATSGATGGRAAAPRTAATVS